MGRSGRKQMEGARGDGRPGREGRKGVTRIVEQYFHGVTNFINDDFIYGWKSIDGGYEEGEKEMT